MIDLADDTVESTEELCPQPTQPPTLNLRAGLLKTQMAKSTYFELLSFFTLVLHAHKTLPASPVFKIVSACSGN